MRRCLAIIFVIIIIVAVLAVAFIYSGIYSVAANYPDRAPAEWVLSNTMDHSVKRHARNIKVPPLDNPAMVKAGASRYKEMCVGCHGAPGTPLGKIGEGFNPSPPELTEAAADWKPNELFWITKNGIRMSAMPAWGVVLSDKEIWNIVSFVQKLPKMKPAEYKSLTGAGASAKP